MYDSFKNKIKDGLIECKSNNINYIGDLIIDLDNNKYKMNSYIYLGDSNNDINIRINGYDFIFINWKYDYLLSKEYNRDKTSEDVKDLDYILTHKMDILNILTKAIKEFKEIR